MGWGGSPNPREAHQEKKHCRAVSTHCSFTRDPPQKCWPCLEEWGLQGTVSPWHTGWTCHLLARTSEARDRFPPSAGMNREQLQPLLGRQAVVPHRLRKLTVQGEFPGCPPTTRSLKGRWSRRGTLLPHFSNSTWSRGQNVPDETPIICRWEVKCPLPTPGLSVPGGSRIDGGWSSSERGRSPSLESQP